MPQTVGLALGGGGARGWSHIGVLRALEDHHIPIHYIAGTSIGALVGAIYVKDELHQLEAFSEEIDTSTLLSLMDVSFPGLGLIDGREIRQFLAGYLVDAKIEDGSIPFQCVATNFLSKEEVVFASGPMVDAVRASISMPGIFVPPKHNGSYLVDGGVVNPVPVNVVKRMGADVVIAVNLNRDPKSTDAPTESRSTNQAGDRSKSPSQSPSQNAPQSNSINLSNTEADRNFAQRLVRRYDNLKTVLDNKIDDWMPDPSTGMNIFDVLGNSINMMEQKVTHANLRRDVPDILIEPNLMEFGIFDFRHAQPMIQRGYDATQEAMPNIQDKLAKAGIEGH